jgi:hypothetical protein
VDLEVTDPHPRQGNPSLARGELTFAYAK